MDRDHPQHGTEEQTALPQNPGAVKQKREERRKNAPKRKEQKHRKKKKKDFRTSVLVSAWSSKEESFIQDKSFVLSQAGAEP